MKTKRRLIFIYLQIIGLFIMSSSILISCDDKKEGQGGAIEYDPSKPVELTTFHPNSGRISESVILQGSNFGNDPSLVKVYFNKKRASVIKTAGDRMLIMVPRMPGDTCSVSVVVGNDSVIYNQNFYYRMSVSVSDVVGNGTPAYQGGALSESTLRPAYICVDNEGNIFASSRESANNQYGIIRINEMEGLVTSLIMGNSALIIPDALCPDKKTGIIYIPSEHSITGFYTCDPKEYWAPRMKNIIWRNLNGHALPVNPWKHSMGFCELDGCVYTRFYDGQIVKINPKTMDTDIVYMTAAGTSEGVTFDPLHPEMLYLAVRSGSMAGGIYSMDIRDPSSFKRLNAAGSGHRDGELSQALFNAPYQIYFDPDGNLYIADKSNHCIRRIRPDHIVETVVGIPGVAGWKNGSKEDALFNNPQGVGVDGEGTVYVADYGNSRVRKLAIE